MIPKKIFCPKCLLPERDIAFKDDLNDFYNYIKENIHKEKKTTNEQLLSYGTYKKLYKK